jgi:hypothetical protein
MSNPMIKLSPEEFVMHTSSIIYAGVNGESMGVDRGGNHSNMVTGTNLAPAAAGVSVGGGFVNR